MSQKPKREKWSSQTGVILAVAGSAVGLANFLRFPGQAAHYGGGAFMIAYVVSLVVLALPIAWAEWTMGRYGGQHGFSSSPSILNTLCEHPLARYLGILGVLVPLVIYMYYSYVESWCLGYAINFITDQLNFKNIEDSKNFWISFIGADKNGSALGFGPQQVGLYLILAFAINFTLIYRGISRGIEKFCRYAVPTLILIACIVLIRALTLGAPDPSKPERNIINGLGFMWNPTKVILQEQISQNPLAPKAWVNQEELIGQKTIQEKTTLAKRNPDRYRITNITPWDQLKRPSLWLAAASQVFFSLSAGLGLIMTYASYMRKDDDVVLSSLSASSANEFCEVGLGGLISLPAAYAYLGIAGVAGSTTFALGFKALPMVFSSMPMGPVFGFLFFFLLFLAAVNASLSTLQPSIAFLEEHFHINRNRSVGILSIVAVLGCGFVVYFSADAKALDSLDFWAGQFLVFVSATVQIIIFGWVLGVDKGLKEANRGAAVKIPRFFKFIMKYLCPFFLITILIMWILTNLGVIGNEVDSHIVDLFGSKDQAPSLVAWMSIGIILTLYLTMAFIIKRTPHYEEFHNKNTKKVKP